jgi:hypothetical protein
MSATPMLDLLDVILSGRPARFDNTRRPNLLPLLPARHAFSATCPCHDCGRVWEGGR